MSVHFGWYAVMPLAELGVGKVKGFRFAGEDWVVYRTEHSVHVTENRCQHLGGRLDRTGVVVGDRLQCSLHGYQFDADGRGERKGCALHQRLKALPARVHSGMIFAWYDPAGEAPRFDLPALDEQGWSPMSFRVVELETQPELIMQDLVDGAHFETIHDYRNITYKKRPTFEEHKLSIEVLFDWDTGLPAPVNNVPARFTSEAHGLGYQHTETWSAGERYHTRHLVLPVPVDENTTRVYLGVCARVHGRVGRLGGRVLQSAAHHFIVAMFKRDIARDARLWVDTYPFETTTAPDADVAAFREWVAAFQSTPKALQETA
ncbi:MAG: Rieske 2Fe-2S domain-containing protein [Proteobacteria bacterium]|nr:Rieske 2Fe-2S domain-containing protein [Pseudomonadota bacterium]